MLSVRLSLAERKKENRNKCEKEKERRKAGVYVVAERMKV